jgi:hypothetical protein
MRSTPEEPATQQYLRTDPALPCPGFYVADVSLAAGQRDGRWGVEILVTGGERLLQGGLNLGGGLGENGAFNGWGGFNIQNPLREPQQLRIDLAAQPLATPGYSDSNLRIRVEVLDSARRSTGASASGVPPLQLRTVLQPGFYVVEVWTLAGSPRATFQMAAETGFLDRAGGGFQGGVNVGGHLTRNAAGESLHGFAGFCISEDQLVTFQTFGAPSYPGAGAGDLLLQIFDWTHRRIH